MAKRILIGVLIALGIIVIVVGSYVAYVMTSYYRLEDSIELDVKAPASDTSPIAEVPTDTDLRIVTSNLGFGAYGPDFDFFMDGGSGSVAANATYVRNNINGAADALRLTQPDFILFQEVDTDGTRSQHVNEYDLLRSDFPDLASVFAQNYDSPFLMWPLYAPHGANKAGMATFSKYAIDDATRRSLPISDSFSKFLDLDRCYSICRLPVANGKQLVLFNVHLSAYGADESIMAAQRSMLFEDMRQEYAQGNYVIAGGDYNHDMIGISNQVYGNKTSVVESWAKPFDFASVPDGFTVGPKAQIDAGTFASAATCRDAGRPYDGTNDRWVMDAFIYSDNIDCTSYETLDLNFAFSDHNPVAMSFKLRQL